jgi:hypothetical protein
LAIGTAASSIQSGQGGIGAGISAVGAGLSFLPGVGMLAGIGTSIVGSIVSGFEQANAEKEAAKEQKKIELRARLVELQADSLNEKRTALGALVGKGQDIAGANKTLNKIKTAASTSLNNLKDAQGTNTDALVSGLLTSDILSDAVISSKSRDAIIKAATTAAASGIYSTTDASTGATTINYDALQSALEAAFTGEDGQGKGLAGIKAFQSRVGKTRLTTTGAAVETNAAIAIETAKQNAITLSPAITKLQGILDTVVGPNGQSEYTGGNPFANATTRTKTARAKDFGISVEKLESLNRAELLATIRQQIASLKAETSAATVTVKPVINPITNQEKLFRDAMANIGKPKKLPDPLPTPTTSFYKNSVTNGQTQITLLSDIKTALTTSKQTIELKDATGKVVSTYTVENGVNG